MFGPIHKDDVAYSMEGGIANVISLTLLVFEIL